MKGGDADDGTRVGHTPVGVQRCRLVVLTAQQCVIDRYRALLRRGETLPLVRGRHATP